MSNLKNVIKIFEEINKDVKYLNIKTIDFDINHSMNFKNISEPILVKGLCKHTNAYKTWNMDNITNILGDEKVDIEVFRNFDDAYMCTTDKMVKYNATDFIKYSEKQYLYMGELDINQFKKPELFNDVYNPYINNDSHESVIFFGKNVGSTTHVHVLNDYILNQIFGEKIVYLFDFYDNYEQGLKFGNPCDPNDELFLKKDNAMNIDDSDIRLIDHNKLKIYKVTLKPGDSLLIPPWWWHNAFSEEFSCSITKKYSRTDHFYLLKYTELLIYNFCLFLNHSDIVSLFNPDFFSNYSPTFIQFVIINLSIIFYFVKIILISIIMHLILYSFDISHISFKNLLIFTFVMYTLHEFYYL
jgi:hypothetical protein